MYVKNKRKAVKYSGKLCVLSLITVTSLCVVGGKDAKASLRSRFSGIASQVANLFRGIGDGINNGVMNLRSRTSSTTTGSITGNTKGLQVKQTVGDGKVTITVSLVDENGTQKVFPKQPTSAMEKLLWKPGNYSEQRYVGSDGKTKRFAFKISGTSGSGTSSRTSSSGSSSSTSTTSVSLSSSRGSSSITTSVGTRNNQDGVDGSGGIGSGASSGTKAYISRLNLLMTKDGDKIKFVEQSKVAFNGKVTQQGKGIADKLKVQSSSTSSKLTPITTISGGPSTSSGSGTTTTVTTTTATGTSGTTTTSSTGMKTSTTTNPGGSGTSSTTSTLSNVKLSSPQTTSTSARGVTKLTTTSTTGTGTSNSSATTPTGTTTSSSTGATTTVTTSTGTTTTPTVSSSGTSGTVKVTLKHSNGTEKQVTAQTKNPENKAPKTPPTTGINPDDSNPGLQKAIEQSLQESNKKSSSSSSTSSSSLSTGGSSSDGRDYQKEGAKPKSRDNKEFDTVDDGRYRPGLETIPEGDESGSASSSRRSSLGSTASDGVDYSAIFDDKEVQTVLSKYSKYAK